MAAKKYLIGYGERLTKKIDHPKKNPSKSNPYTFQKAKERLIPKFEKVISELNNLSDNICPGNEAVTMITVHPQYLAKTYYPQHYLKSNNLRSLGSRQIEIMPEIVTLKKSPDRPRVTYDIYAAGNRNDLKNALASLKLMDADHDLAREIIKIEDIYNIKPTDKIRPIKSEKESIPLEVVLHADSSIDSEYIVYSFEEYLEAIGVESFLEQRIYAGGLCFIPLKAKQNDIEKIAQYTFIRTVREMPKIRVFPEEDKFSIARSTEINFELPKSSAINNSIKVAIFDGGIKEDAEKALSNWVKYYDAFPIGEPIEVLQEHGQMVTSALLFGPLKEGKALEIPFSNIDHYRVLDGSDIVQSNDFELYRILKRITNILETKNYNFVNLSLGPDLPIEDNEPHVWTSKLDKIFENRNILATVAVGNTGERDSESGNSRIQPPADCVNAISIGACNSLGEEWKRAPYSSIGPGRNPGWVKPDAVFFGGSLNEPFVCIDPNNGNINACSSIGTSFASPAALRMGIGIKAHFGDELSQLAINALLVHHAENKTLPIKEVGWGRIPNNLSKLIECSDGEAHIIYQGELEPTQIIKADIPLPSSDKLTGQIKIKATFRFNSKTDPQDPIHYTRSGLNITFFPKKTKQSKPFFKSGDYLDENDLRSNAQKWETSLKAKKTLNPNSLDDPYFTIHYMAREAGHNVKTKDADNIKYALIITINANKMPNIYDEILVRYRTYLEQLRPLIEIPVRHQ